MIGTEHAARVEAAMTALSVDLGLAEPEAEAEAEAEKRSHP